MLSFLQITMSKKENYYVVWKVVWRNPYTTPPDGKRVLLEIKVENSRVMPKEIESYDYPPGYTVSFDYHSLFPSREWSLERKQAARRRNLKQRLQKKFSLFADEMYEAEIKFNRGYYGTNQDIL